MLKKIYLYLILLFVFAIMLLNLWSSRNEMYKKVVFQLQQDVSDTLISIEKFQAQTNMQTLTNAMANFGGLESSYLNWLNCINEYHIDQATQHNLLSIQEEIIKSRKSILLAMDSSELRAEYSLNGELIKQELQRLERIKSLLNYENLKNKSQINKSFSPSSLDDIIIENNN